MISNRSTPKIPTMLYSFHFQSTKYQEVTKKLKHVSTSAETGVAEMFQFIPPLMLLERKDKKIKVNINQLLNFKITTKGLCQK